MIKLLAALIALITELGTVTVRWLVSRGTALRDGDLGAGPALRDPAVHRRLRRASPPRSGSASPSSSTTTAWRSTFPTTPATRGWWRLRRSRRTATAGSAHLWILLPIAAAAAGADRRHLSRAGRALAGAGRALRAARDRRHALAIDLPQGLDAGRAWPRLLRRPGRAASRASGPSSACSATLMLCWRPAGALLSSAWPHRRDGGARERPSAAGRAGRRAASRPGSEAGS